MPSLTIAAYPPTHVFSQMISPGAYGGGGVGVLLAARAPQSRQSVPHAQKLASEPGPPSSQ